MKVEYKNITGSVVKGDYPCSMCCFSNLLWCLPYTIHRCYKHIFKDSNTQIFKL